ncbi:MAG: RluA family pseudouridine synthase [Acidobacteria bacterium]|nr:RluA family pseudouridine synthase [Acidobacteriota bacterium]
MNNKEWQVSEAESGLRLDKWLAAAERLGSRSKALAAIERGKVFVGGVEQTSADAARRMQAGETVRLWMDRPGSAERRYSERRESGLHLLYEDSSLLVINKPAGLLTVPLPSQPDEPSLFDQIKNHLRSHRKREPLVVHRIDRDTSGIVLFAKTVEAQRKLKNQFKQRKAERIYLAVVHGHPKPESGTWRDFLVWNRDSLKQQRAERRDRNAQEAICHYRTLEEFKEASLIEVRLVTGKRNQIRVQAALRGHPLVGEKKYIYEPAPQPIVRFGRQALHAHRLSFSHPVDGRALSFETPLTDDIESLLKRCRRPD